MAYFSERELGARPRTEEEINQTTWGGLVVTINERIDDGSFGYRYPEECKSIGNTIGSMSSLLLLPFPFLDVCEDGGRMICGCDSKLFSQSLAAEVSGITIPLDINNQPSTLTILDLLEFCHRAVGKPNGYYYHKFKGHHHLDFNQEEGQTELREDVNRIFSRNGLAYELGTDGKIVRLAPEGLRESLMSSTFHTDDEVLDSLIETARTKYINPDINVRHESLEKLWDAWERLKTIESGKDKKESITALLNKAANDATFVSMINQEAKELTHIGNTFKIRHSEIAQVPLESSEHVDYLYHRLFALIRLLLLRTGRCK